MQFLLDFLLKLVNMGLVIAELPLYLHVKFFQKPTIWGFIAAIN